MIPPEYSAPDLVFPGECEARFD